jgi:hypothetical protein
LPAFHLANGRGAKNITVGLMGARSIEKNNGACKVMMIEAVKRVKAKSIHGQFLDFYYFIIDRKKLLLCYKFSCP